MRGEVFFVQLALYNSFQMGPYLLLLQSLFTLCSQSFSPSPQTGPATQPYILKASPPKVSHPSARPIFGTVQVSERDGSAKPHAGAWALGNDLRTDPPPVCHGHKPVQVLPETQGYFIKG